MRIITYTEARNNLKNVLDSTIDNAEVTVIHRRDGEDAVLMGRDYYDSLQETLYLLGNPSNARALFKAIEQDKTGASQKRQSIQADE